MEIRNTIDVQQLKVTPQDADNTYLGIDKNGELVRTKIELSGTGGGEVNLDDYYTKAEVDTKITDTEQEINTKQDIITDLDTIRGGAAKGAIAFGDYNNIKKNIYDVQEDVSAVQEDVNNIVTNKWELKSGDKTIAGNYGTYTVGDLKTINGQSLIGTEDIVIEGSSGGGTIVELTGSKPTLDEFNILYESAIAGTPTYVKYSDGTFNVIADLSGNKKGVYHIYGDGNNLYTVYWFIRSGETRISETKKQLSGMYGVKDYVESQDLKYRLPKQTMISELPKYFRDYSYNFSVPLSVRKNENVSMILDGKLYYWDFADTTNMDGSYYLPKIVDLLNISGGGDVNLDDYYTKTEIDDMIGDINNILETI